jgi:hypothetical protein
MLVSAAVLAGSWNGYRNSYANNEILLKPSTALRGRFTLQFLVLRGVLLLNQQFNA